MALPGPILIVSDRPDRKLAIALAGAGAVSVVETALAGAAGAIARIQPAAVLFADPDPEPARLLADDLMAAIDAFRPGALSCPISRRYKRKHERCRKFDAADTSHIRRVAGARSYMGSTTDEFLGEGTIVAEGCCRARSLRQECKPCSKQHYWGRDLRR